MRIIAGRFRGRTIEAPKGRGTRPTTDRVRESLFNWLVHHDDIDLENARIADLFAGTGALGLEALSRGAQFATFVEKDRAALAALRQNITSLKVEDETQILAMDATRLPKAMKPYDIIFLDPPYGSPFGAAALHSARTQNWFKPESFIIWETAANEDLNSAELNLHLSERRRYGDTALNLLHL